MQGSLARKAAKVLADDERVALDYEPEIDQARFAWPRLQQAAFLTAKESGEWLSAEGYSVRTVSTLNNHVKSRRRRKGKK